MPSDDSGAEPAALVLTPEPAGPVAGGGALRTASLLEYLRRRYRVDVIAFESDIPLPRHSRHPVARAGRNALRLARGVPPLVDRFAGFEGRLRELLGERRWDLGLIEHFWCAPYAEALRPHCRRLALDLHNVESELAASRAGVAEWPLSAAHSRFAQAYRELERLWLPKFDLVLTASEEDAARVGAGALVFPNALPERIVAPRLERDCIVFSGNLEYDPNIVAVRFFHMRIWPRLRQRYPGLEWRLVGRNPNSVARLVGGDPRIHPTGPVEDAIAELATAKVCVVPVLTGSGTRFKILEAWCASRAVVSTTLGAEGLGARDGQHLLLADAPEAFADAVSRVLESVELRASLGAAGRRLFEERFTWPAAWRRLEDAGL